MNDWAILHLTCSTFNVCYVYTLPNVHIRPLKRISREQAKGTHREIFQLPARKERILIFALLFYLCAVEECSFNSSLLLRQDRAALSKDKAHLQSRLTACLGSTLGGTSGVSFLFLPQQAGVFTRLPPCAHSFSS